VSDYFNDTTGHYPGNRRTPRHFRSKRAVFFGFSLYLIYDFQELHGFTHQICRVNRCWETVRVLEVSDIPEKNL
jgi:hypothetical protein